MRRVAVILYILIRSSLRGIQSSAVTTGIAVVTIAIALVLVGAFTLLVANMQSLLQRFGEDLHVVAYLETGLPLAEQSLLAERIATVEGVARALSIDEEQALERFRSTQGGAALLEGLEENPLPASIDITLAAGHRTPEGLAILRSALEGLPGVEEVAHGQEWIEGYARAAALMRTAGFVLGTVLSLATLLIVANTIRLGVYAREDELDILALVGASRTYVRVPFLLEGTLQGAIGGVIAVVLLWCAFHLLVPQIQYGLAFFLGGAEPRFFDLAGMIRLVTGGAGLGLVGSATALMGWRS